LPLFLTSLSLHTYKRWRSGNGQRELNKREIMKGNRGKLIINERFEMDSGREEKAKCDIEIYKKEGEQYEVILTTPDFEEYKDIPVDYFFEEFATGIKKHYLNNISSDSIKWIERVKFSDSKFHPDYEESYDLNFDGEKYLGFDFERCILKKLNILAKRINPNLKGEPKLVPVYFK
jgi:hypothetical protein